MKGIKAENNGLYEEAATSYEDALREIKKTRFHRNLEIEIRQKLKVLHTVTTYTKDQDFVRENNSWIRNARYSQLFIFVSVWPTFPLQFPAF